ncbi:MAG: nitroreductase [Deltaproteobacteria bacterium CG_4_8_14_3_um_filter_45_9]|jgi:nitroreductase|nr:MAG: nitroreductase [Deltaproteobacteria bacterium CG03_land_8_20_14_0_80_45_14]PIX23885.1 MAG: nitroreductase [Deltaproteobacteria bacterium CG_4_8_14_3_um_filter_45_9]
MNEVLKAIKNRRTVRRFKPNPIDEEKIQMILEAGRWAPSFSNLQPWRFIVIKDQGLKSALDKAARESVLHLGINEAPVVILVCVDRRIDPLHAIEAGAAATQNMTLAAYSLGLGAGWIGIWGTEAEASIQKIFKLPETVRAVSLLPIGIPDESPESHRKPLEELTQFR